MNRERERERERLSRKTHREIQNIERKRRDREINRQIEKDREASPDTT